MIQMTNLTMKSESQTVNTEYLAQAAYLISRGFTQDETGALLGLNKNEVSRLVRRARAVGLLKRPVFCEQVFLRLWPDPEKRINLDDLRFGLKLLKGFKDKKEKKNLPEYQQVKLTQVKVLSGVSREVSQEAWEKRLEDFGFQALPYLFDLLSKAKVCALGWGATIGAVVSAAEREWLGEKLPHPILVASCGELFDHLGFNNASSSLVERLHLLLNGTKSADYTFRGVPALLNDPTLREFYCQKHPGYRAVFGPGGFVGKFDGIVTSAGTFEQVGVHAFKRALIAEWSATEESLKRISWGDLGGVLVPRYKSTKDGRPEFETGEDRKEFDRISSLWSGITLEHYRETATRAFKLAVSQAQEIPGVVVFAIGKTKAEIVHEIIKAGLVNRVVVDLDLAKYLAALAGIDLAKDIRSAYRPDHRIETVQEIITAFDRLPDEDKSAVRKHLDTPG